MEAILNIYIYIIILLDKFQVTPFLVAISEQSKLDCKFFSPEILTNMTQKQPKAIIFMN